MKVIVTGATGFAGGEVLSQLLNSCPKVTSVVALARRPKPDSIEQHPKLKWVVINDFLNYSDDVKNEMKGVGACIWALGAPNFKDMEEGRKVSIDYTVKGMDEMLAAHKAGGEKTSESFRFVYVSGGLVERDQEKSLWIKGEFRKMRGMVENKVVAFQKDNQGVETFVARPGGIVRPGGVLRSIQKAVFLGFTVNVSHLAAALIKFAMEGNTLNIVENADLNSIGEAAFNAKSS